MGVYTVAPRSDELYHFGVLGMKWGVRRYQNYDGSYTKKGMEHYRESERKYNVAKNTTKSAKQVYKNQQLPDGTPVNVSKNVVKQAKQEERLAKKQLKNDYRQLRRDKAGDKGKKLYQTGHTITGNQNQVYAAAAIAAGGSYVAKYLMDNGNTKAANIAIGATIGAEVVNGILAAKGMYQNHYLRAYYGHSRAKTNPGRS